MVVSFDSGGGGDKISDDSGNDDEREVMKTIPGKIKRDMGGLC